MADKKLYYVTIDTKEVRPYSVPDNEIEFEIRATEEQVLEIEEVFAQLNKESKNAAEYIATTPFDEWGVDDERSQYQDDIKRLFHIIATLGTEESKKKLQEMGINNS